MDFKARNPNISYWPEESLVIHHPFPFDFSNTGGVCQIDAPDDSTSFLAFGFHGSDCEQYMISYLIEAPEDG